MAQIKDSKFTKNVLQWLFRHIESDIFTFHKTAPNMVMLVESVNKGYGTVLLSFSVSRSRLDTIDGVTRIIDEVVQETH